MKKEKQVKIVSDCEKSISYLQELIETTYNLKTLEKDRMVFTNCRDEIDEIKRKLIRRYGL